MEFHKKQLDSKLSYDVESARRLKELEKKCAAQEKVIAELRRVIGTFNKLRDHDQDKLREYERTKTEKEHEE